MRSDDSREIDFPKKNQKSVTIDNHLWRVTTKALKARRLMNCINYQNVALAITLYSASSKFRNDIIEVILVTYRLKG